MKKTVPLLFVAILVSIMVTAVNIPLFGQQKDSKIVLSSAIKYGESLSFVIKPTPNSSKIQIDWGDGALKTYTIRPNAYAYERKVQGSIKGKVITVIGDIEEFEATNSKLTAFTPSGQANLKLLDLSDNSLTRETLQLEGLNKLENLNLSRNKLTLLKLDTFKELIYLNASENPNLGAVLLPAGSNKLKSVSLNKCDISSFPAVMLPELTSLNLGENALMEISLGDSYPKLANLTLNQNYLTTLELDGLNELQQLNVANNQIDNLNLSKLTKLTMFYAQQNKLSAVDVSNCPKITRINVSNNNLTKVDVSKQSLLIELDCSNNHIANLNLENNTYLKTLRAANNKLMVLNFHKNTSLTLIDIRNNSAFTPCSINFMFNTMWDNPRPGYSTNLFLEGCNAEGADEMEIVSEQYKWKPDIKFVERSKKAVCKELNINLKYNNRQGHVVLEQFNPITNKIEPITNKANSGWETYARITSNEGFYSPGILVDGKKIEANPFVLSNDNATIEVQWKEENSITLSTIKEQPLSFAITPFTNDDIIIDWGDGTEQHYSIGKDVLKRIDGVALGNRIVIKGELLAADFSSYPGMGTWDNKFSGVSIKGMANLSELLLYMNPIKQLNTQTLKNLSTLDCAYTDIELLDLTSNKKLNKLVCFGNGLTSLNLSENKRLKELDCRNNKLTELNLNDTPELIKLDVQNNALGSVDLTKLTQLEELKLNNNNLTLLELSNNAQLVTLAVTHNKLKQLNTEGLKQLKVLYVNDNAIKGLNLSKNEKLIYLNCANNGLSACELNDLFATLPAYPTEVTDKIADNCSLRVSDKGTHQRNDVASSETVLATHRGWSVNETGNGAGCDDAYVFIVPALNGTIALQNKQGENVASGTKVTKGDGLSVIATPNEKYKLAYITVNGVEEEAATFTIEKATWVQGVFAIDNATDSPVANKYFYYCNNTFYFDSHVDDAMLYNSKGEVIATKMGNTLTIPTHASNEAMLFVLTIQNKKYTYKLMQ